MILSHKYKFIFFANPKTATTAIEKALKNIDETNTIAEKLIAIEQKYPFLKTQNLIHIRPQYLQEAIDPEIWHSYYKFVFVRNPWDWVLSQYNQNFCKIGSNKYKLGLVLHNLFLQPHPNIDMRRERYFLKRDFDLHWNFQKRRRGIKEEKNSFQYQFVRDSNGNKLVDYIGRYENLKADLERVFNKVGLEHIKLPVANKSHGKSLSYRDYYREDTKALVADKYREDIALFGYEF
ncbi:MAG: sulfotransferase family 2 domain-containing protein [Prochloraceae cyanobacterium]